jgi:hypothetical protein
VKLNFSNRIAASLAAPVWIPAVRAFKADFLFKTGEGTEAHAYNLQACSH